MRISIFAKQRSTHDGRSFISYITKLHRISTDKDFTAQVKFRADCGAPDASQCPCTIEVSKEKCNLSSATFTDTASGEVKESFVLWVTEWSNPEKYVDKSLDDIAE